jgi:hypothetical protein
MNLTKWCIVGLCVTAMTASASFIKTNDFENAFGTGGWSGPELGVEDIVSGITGVTTDSPMPDVPDTKVLQLDTQGATWTNTVGSSFNTLTNWVDMLVKFVPSEELPFIDTDVRLAIAVKQGTPNVLAISVIEQEDNLTNAWIVTTGAVDTNTWCRLTVEIYNNGGYAFANIKTNGVLVNVAPYYVKENDKAINSIGFQGTGFIDEVVVRDDSPFGGPPPAVQLTLSFASGIASVYVGETQKLTTETVDSGSDLIITATQWKEIASVTGADTTTWVAGVAGDSVATVKVVAASATTVTITAQTETSTDPIGGATDFSTEESNKVASWALANSVTTLSDGIYPNYLFNIPTNVVPSLFITSIAVSNTTVTVEVQTTNNVDLVTGINGTLQIKAYPVLGGTPEIFFGTFTGTTNITTFTQDIGTNKFVRASVE